MTRYLTPPLKAAAGAGAMLGLMATALLAACSAAHTPWAWPIGVGFGVVAAGRGASEQGWGAGAEDPKLAVHIERCAVAVVIWMLCAAIIPLGAVLVYVAGVCVVTTMCWCVLYVVGAARSVSSDPNSGTATQAAFIAVFALGLGNAWFQPIPTDAAVVLVGLAGWAAMSVADYARRQRTSAARHRRAHR